MKISKVDHIKAGVGVGGDHPKGILYEDPKKGAENCIDLKTHVNNLNKNAKRLYSIFNANKIKDKRKKGRYNDIVNSFKRFNMQILGKYRSDFSQEKNVSYQIKRLDQWIVAEQSKINGVRFEDIDGAVDDLIRKSLCKYVSVADYENKVYVPDLIKKLLRSVIRTELDKPDQLSRAEKESLLRILNEDYGKEKMLERVVHSIEAQNVRVDCVENDGRSCLQLSNAQHQKKRYIFLFIQKFAAAEDEDQRKELLLYIKRLILLFYCGEDKYKESLEIHLPVWNWGVMEEEGAVNFDDDCYRMINELASINDDEAEKRKIKRDIQKKLRKKISDCYRMAVAVEGMTEEDKFWIQYIENSAEKILLGKRDVNPVKLSVSYLCQHTYREWVSYICMKYIDMGKGVYHFTVPEDLKKVISGEEVIGEVLPEYRGGITSFDHERIKAEDMLNRDISLYISFAVNNFAMSVASSDKRKKDKNEDILSVPKNELEKIMYDDTDRRLLRFFGGKSTWNNRELDGIRAIDLVESMKQALFSIRNCNFHYTSSEPVTSKADDHILQRVFEKEFSETGDIYRKRYFSNNVWMFYSQRDIMALMDVLYCKEPERPAQVPAFGKIINKANIEEMINRFIKGKKKKKLQSGEGNVLERMEKFRASLFFLLKEIYYYGFLQDGRVKKYFMDVVENEERSRNPDPGGNNNENKEAHKDFKNYINILIASDHDITFGEICQHIMTDYNQQNQGKKEIAVNAKGNSEEKYKHFRMLLYSYIRTAFLKYLKEQECYCFLREPEKYEGMTKDITEGSFCEGWFPHLYDRLGKKMEKDPILYSWYVLAHFLNSKQLNMLIGCIKNYIQYVQDIERRRRDTENCNGRESSEKIRKYKDILPVLEFSMLFCGRITNCFEDYFSGEEDYVEHLANYVDLGKKDIDARTALKEFCGRPVKKGSPTGKIGLYYDELNPIINKNIVYAEMYGNEKLFCNCYKKVSEKDIQTYYRDKDGLEYFIKNGKCKDEDEERLLRRFQSEKNHIELTEITTYSEIVNDFMGQLISWAYLRERDLMYFQLGFHYMRLFYSDCVEEDSFLRRLEGEDIHIQSNALLYQIIAMYTYELPVFIRDECGKAKKEKDFSSSGKSVRSFYKDYCKDRGEIYELGLALFENVKGEHDEIVCFRNYIDHFKYYSKMDRSIIDLYSDIYDRFFTYDIKLRKSVSFIFRNILQRYFVIAETEMHSGISKCYDGEKKVKEKAARLSIKELRSDHFQLSKGVPPKESTSRYIAQRSQSSRLSKEDHLIKARDENFLKQLKQILEYSEG